MTKLNIETVKIQYIYLTFDEIMKANSLLNVKGKNNLCDSIVFENDKLNQEKVLLLLKTNALNNISRNQLEQGLILMKQNDIQYIQLMYKLI